MPPPRFITFEGSEAVGKSTQIELLAARVKERGDQVLVTREPLYTLLGEEGFTGRLSKPTSDIRP